MTPFLVAAVVLGVPTALLYAARTVLAARRRAAVRAWAAEHEWSYAERDDAVLDGLAGAPFDRALAHRARNVVRGHRGRCAFTSCDARLTLDTGDGSTRRTYSVLLVETPAGPVCDVRRGHRYPHEILARVETLLGRG